MPQVKIQNLTKRAKKMQILGMFFKIFFSRFGVNWKFYTFAFLRIFVTGQLINLKTYISLINFFTTPPSYKQSFSPKENAEKKKRKCVKVILYVLELFFKRFTNYQTN
jgi:hypothetical protein